MATCDIDTLIEDAKCFACLPKDQQDAVELQLLCEIVAAGGGGGASFQSISFQSAGPIDGEALWVLQSGDGGTFFGTSGDMEFDANVITSRSDGNTIIGTHSAGVGVLRLTDWLKVSLEDGYYEGDGQGLTNVGGVKQYRAFLSQTGTGTPTVAATMINTVGAIVWTRNDVGDYTGTLTGAFLANKVVPYSQITALEDGKALRITRISNNAVSLITAGVGGALEDDLLSSTYVEILVYP